MASSPPQASSSWSFLAFVFYLPLREENESRFKAKNAKDAEAEVESEAADGEAVRIPACLF